LRGEPFDKLRAVSPSNGVRVRVSAPFLLERAEVPYINGLIGHR